MIVEAPAGERFARVVAAALPALSRRQIRALFEAGRVRVVGGGRARPGARSPGAQLEIAADHPSDAAVPDPLPLVIAFESPHWVIVDKPAKMPSAPVDPGERGTVANALVARYPEMAGVGFRPREPGLCHRLDNDTSGLLLAARDAGAFEAARRALREGRIDKRYLLVCRDGHALGERGRIDRRLSSRGDRVAIDPAGRPALTEYVVLRRGGGRALVEARAAGAFRHQLRAHFAAIGSPLLGDRRYGGEPVGDRHALHASRLGFAGEPGLEGFEATSELPEDLAALIP